MFVDEPDGPELQEDQEQAEEQEEDQEVERRMRKEMEIVELYGVFSRTCSGLSYPMPLKRLTNSTPRTNRVIPT